MKDFFRYFKEGLVISGYVTSFVFSCIFVSGLAGYIFYYLTGSKLVLVFILSAVFVFLNLIFYKRLIAMSGDLADKTFKDKR